jgi:hypothetical protein
MDTLEARVLKALRPALGQRLAAVRYWCLRGEATLVEALARKFYHGGYVELAFDEGPAIMVSWDENAGWSDHFSVQVISAERVDFLHEYYEEFDVSASPVWQAYRGAPLTAAAVCGWRGVPHVVRLCFPAGEVMIGDGCQDAFGDGDDVLIRTGEDFRQHPEAAGLETLWSSGPVA